MSSAIGNMPDLTSWTPHTVVMGSGAAGMAAALTLAAEGKQVLVLEASQTFGGTTAVSGGVLWVPCNDRMKGLGIPDDTETAVAYVSHTAAGKSSESMIRAWIENAPTMARELERLLNADFLPLETYPDYQPELPGGKTGGRSMDNPLFNTNDLEQWRPLLRTNPITGRAPMTIGEAMAWGVFSKPFDFPYKEVAQRAKDGIVHGGAALMGRCLQRGLVLGVRFVANARVRGVKMNAKRVVGVEVDYNGESLEIPCENVIMASGGFDWHNGFRRTFLPINPTHPASIPSLKGDALRIAQGLGAQLGNMAEAWWVPTVEVPGELYDNAPLYRSEFSVRCLPHAMIVNRDGRRFVNEALNYNDVVKPFLAFDPVRYQAQNQPAWLVVDGQFLKKYMYITAVPGRELPDYVRQANTLQELAKICNINADGLQDEVARYNTFVENGIDEDFHKGEGAFERFYGDPTYTANPNLGSLKKAPFCAVPIYAGCIGTKGGAQTNENGQVLHVDGEVIQGLYAAGNAMASPAGAGYPGAGSTISIALTFGWLAAHHIAKTSKA